ASPFQGLTQHEVEWKERRAAAREQQQQFQRQHGTRDLATGSRGSPSAATRRSPSRAGGAEEPTVEVKHTRSSALKAAALEARARDAAVRSEMEEAARHEAEERRKSTERAVRDKLRGVLAAAASAAPASGAGTRGGVGIAGGGGSGERAAHSARYRATLDAIGERLGDRLCLFERQAVDSARRKAESDAARILRQIPS
ncbi:hypothetical protein HK405_007929, partial [Cladochytrium tenue]